MTYGKPQREQPWSIRGVSAEAKTAAGMAAKRGGVTLGAWLDRVVMDAASEQLSSRGKQEVGPTAAEIMAEVAKMIAGVNQRLDQVQAEAAAKAIEPQKMGMGKRLRVLVTGKPGGQ